jgi:hypothetical protein
VNESERVVRQSEVRAEIDGAFEFFERLLVVAAQPKGTADRPVGGWIAIVDHKALARSFVRTADFGFAVGPALKRVQPPEVDFEALKACEQQVWSPGDDAVVETMLQIVG